MPNAVTCEHGKTPKSVCKVCQREANKRSAAKYASPAKNRANYLKNRSYQCVQSHNQRAKQYGAPGLMTIEDLEEIISQNCIYCDYNKYIELDHKIPLSKGGSNHRENFQPVCGFCNRAKGSFSEVEFLDWFNRLKQGF